MSLELKLFYKNDKNLIFFNFSTLQLKYHLLLKNLLYFYELLISISKLISFSYHKNNILCFRIREFLFKHLPNIFFMVFKIHFRF